MRTCKLVLCFMLILTMLTCPIPLAGAAAEFATGDVDNNGDIDSLDALTILQHNVGIEKLTGAALDAADVDDSGEVDAVDSLWILQYSVGSVKRFPKDMTEEERYYFDRDTYYGVADSEDFLDYGITNLDDVNKLLTTVGKESAPSDIENNPLNENGWLLYNPISDAAKKMGTLNKYRNAKKVTGKLELGGTVFQYSVPTNVTAYDAVPVEYTVYNEKGGYLPFHISATTFEEPERYEEKDGLYYDCNLPGRTEVEITYNGYMSAKADKSLNPLWNNRFNDKQGSEYPGFVLNEEELVKSGTVSSKNDYTWFNFSFKNVGNTILDSVGNGAFNFYPLLQKKNDAGSYETVRPDLPTDNYMKRIFDYLYPGESEDMWLLFVTNHVDAADGRYRLTPGEYRIVIQSQLRNERDRSNWQGNYVNGQRIAEDTFEFLVDEEGGMTTPNKVVHEDMKAHYMRNGWIGSYEEFQSSYQSLNSMSSDKNKPTTGIIYVQQHQNA